MSLLLAASVLAASPAPTTPASKLLVPVAGPQDVPAITGPGAVLTAGRLTMKVTNDGVLGNPFTSVSADPSAQWPGASGVEYLNFIGLAVGAVNPLAATPELRHRVSSLTEWHPASLDPVDRMYSTAEGAANGTRFVNDDGDLDPQTGLPRVDEDFLDGRDEDGDGIADEDFGALGQQEWTCLMRDDTPQTIGQGSEAHVPLGLECRQAVWCYAASGYSDFNVADYEIVNRSGHELDSVFVGFQVDPDAGPITRASFWSDDRDLPGFPHGVFPMLLPASDPRRQANHDPAVPEVAAGQPLCWSVPFRVNGFSVADADGDGGLTPGIATFLLVDHTTDPLGVSAPVRVGFRAFRSFVAGTPYAQGGNPSVDAQRYALLSSNENVDAEGFVDAAPGAAPGDYQQWCSVGPFLHLADGASIHVTVAFLVQTGTWSTANGYAADYAAWQSRALTLPTLLTRYPSLGSALNLAATFDGGYEFRAGLPVPDFHGRESGRRAPTGQTLFLQDCRNGIRAVTDQATSWFDFDCDYCTGPWSASAHLGYFHHTWQPATWTAVTSADSPTPAVTGARVAPNPSAGGATIRFSLARAARVEIEILDVAGRRIRSFPVTLHAAGRVEAPWDGRDDAGSDVAGGVYLYRVRTADQDLSGRIVLTR